MFEALESRRLLATSGLNAVYFNNSDFTGSTVARNDKSINLALSGTSSHPAGTLGGTTFSVRWNGIIKPYTSETYTFITKNTDGVRVWVNGKLIIDSWKAQPTTTHTGTIALKANRLYDLRVEYYNGNHVAKMSLSWDTPSRSAGLVPSSRLFAYDTRGANVGDFGFDSSREGDVANMIKKWKPDYITTVGDNNQISDDDDWDDFDRVVGKYYHSFIGNYKGDYGAGGQTLGFCSTDSRSVVRNNSDVGALMISANEFAMTLQYQQRSGRVVDTITVGPSQGTLSTSAVAAASVADPLAVMRTYPPNFVGPLPVWPASQDATDGDDAAATNLAGVTI
jgi:hypothetical protein